MLLPPTELALGEAYLHEDFDVEVNLEEATELADFFSTRLRLPALLARRLVRRLRKLPSDDLPQNDGSKSPSRHLRGRRRSRKRDAAAVRSHYDVGNEFYALWLDRRMVYGLTDRCHIEVQDYRELPQRAVFDKVVSVGMFEHVGRAKLPTYFSQAYRLTRPGRLFLNHGIITASSRSASLRVVEKARSWGEEYRALPFPRPHDGGGRRSASISRPLPALRAQRPDRRGRRRREASVRGGALYQTLTM
jgi:mycolic acid cyclopropane synthetase